MLPVTFVWPIHAIPRPHPTHHPQPTINMREPLPFHASSLARNSKERGSIVAAQGGLLGALPALGVTGRWGGMGRHAQAQPRRQTPGNSRFAAARCWLPQATLTAAGGRELSLQPAPRLPPARPLRIPPPAAMRAAGRGTAGAATAALCHARRHPVLRPQVWLVDHQVAGVHMAGRGEGLLVWPKQPRLKHLVCVGG